MFLRTLLGELFESRSITVRIIATKSVLARAWGELHAARQRVGKPLAMVDGLIAATALVRGLTIVTRNSTDFIACGVALVDLWSA